MKRFQFRLGAVLKLRERAEDKRKQELAEALTIRRREQDRCDGLTQDLADHKQTMRRLAASGELNVDTMIVHQRYATNVDFQIRRLRESIRVIDEEVARRRNALAEATRDKKIVEKLRDRQYEAHQAEAERLERYELDEIGQLGHRRRQEA